MELTSPKIIKELLLKYETKASKGLGQNFLIDKKVLNKIIDSADIKPDDIILEVGPGIGTLTQKLAEKAKRVIAVEKDKKMVDILTDVLNDLNVQNVEIVNADILRFERLERLERYKIVANIPYYLTSPLIRKFLEIKNPPQEMVLMLQKEVARRICSKPPNMSLLAVSVQFYADAKIISYVSKNCFWPSPKVDSAIIKIIPNTLNYATAEFSVFTKLFFKIVKAGFSQPRKQLANNLLALSRVEGSKMLKIERKKTEEWLQKNNIEPVQRAETLSIDNWIDLTDTFNNI